MLPNHLILVLLLLFSARPTASHPTQNHTNAPPTTAQFLHGAPNKVPFEYLTDIGDIDNNGHPDYLVSNPSANNHTGSLQLHLITNNHTSLFTRQIIPSTPNSDTPALKPHDNFAASVANLSQNKDRSLSRILVGAPGDANGTGAVYVLTLTRTGNLVHSTKLSASNLQSAANDHAPRNRLGATLSVSHDPKEHGSVKVVVGAASGLPLTVFIKPSGDLQQTPVTKRLEQLTRLTRRASRGSNRSDTARFPMRGKTVRQADSGECLFSDSYCACTLAAAEAGSLACMDVVGTEVGTGRKLCEIRDCEATYECRCDGAEHCSREEVTFTTFVSEGVAGGGRMYCTSVSTTVMQNLVLNVVPFPAPDVRQLVHDGADAQPYTATNCRCSLRSAVQQASTCLDFLREEGDGIRLCSRRACQFKDDEYVCDVFGTTYCGRESVASRWYVSEGDYAEDGVEVCRLESGNKERVRLVT
ncbi:unnamed protein product [Chondrus crispus]|uniref:Uncharacterized protein n=1 Tax=Chondrus crispus TaxID=2769 RepID=R7Q231_CHOCR|nr:unnamed protein product [Chondrus crispus]CDF32647.1 unnamed protein product [Chondrus crispus]|eukprot:XP_005712418.1 unnamed protein product [Chondrus crispus]